MGGGSGSSSTSVVNLLPDWALDVEVPRYLEDMQAYSLDEYTGYSGSTFALQDESFSWTDFQNGVATTHTVSNTFETTGIKNLAARGRDGHTLLTKGESLVSSVIEGGKININPKLESAYLKKAEAIVTYFEETTLPALARQMNYTGNFGSIAHHVLMAKAAEEVMAKLAEIGADVYYKDYVLEKTLQQTSVSDALDFAQQDFVNAELQITAGTWQREYYHAYLTDQYKLWIEMQTGIVRRLEIAGNSIRALLGAQSRESTPYYRPSPMSQIAGLALMGLGAYGMIKGQGVTNKSDSPYNASQQDYISSVGMR